MAIIVPTTTKDIIIKDEQGKDIAITLEAKDYAFYSMLQNIFISVSKLGETR